MLMFFLSLAKFSSILDKTKKKKKKKNKQMINGIDTNNNGQWPQINRKRERAENRKRVRER